MNLQEFFFNSVWVLGIAIVWYMTVVFVKAGIDIFKNKTKK